MQEIRETGSFAENYFRRSDHVVTFNQRSLCLWLRKNVPRNIRRMVTKSQIRSPRGGVCINAASLLYVLLERATWSRASRLAHNSSADVRHLNRVSFAWTATTCCFSRVCCSRPHVYIQPNFSPITPVNCLQIWALREYSSAMSALSLFGKCQQKLNKIFIIL